MWSSQAKRPVEPEYYIVTGRAYPRVIEGTNKTRQIRAHIGDRKRFYWDDAVRLSTATLDDINGAEGKPLCYKHRRHDVVGQVHHSYLDADNNLKITAKIPARTERGRRVIAKIRAGKLNGFSVGYDNHFDPADKSIQNKDFHEISICNQPFFDGCNVENGVYASSSESDGKGVFFGKLSLHHINKFALYPLFDKKRSLCSI